MAIVTALLIWTYNLQKLRQMEEYQRALTGAEAQIIQLTTALVSTIHRASFTMDRELFLSGALSTGGSFKRQKVEALFRNFIQDQPSISQIRWLDGHGMERARIDRLLDEKGTSRFPGAEVLQDKSHRTYFQEARKLKPGQFYNSYLSLNREFGEITLRRQPVVRTATKTHATLGMLDGVLFINFDVSGFADAIHRVAALSEVSIDIIDAIDGRVYVSTEHPELEFGHELQEHAITLWDLDPERRGKQAAFIASGEPSSPISDHEIFLRGPAASSQSFLPGENRRTWVRGDIVPMSSGGLLIHIHTPAERIEADERATRLTLGGVYSLIAFLIVVFAILAFRLERRNILALEESRKLAATKSQFLANMSHEIRTPVTGILGMLDLVETRSENQSNVDKIQFIKRSANSLRQVIDDILDITKLQSGRIELDPAPFKPAETIARVVELYSVSAHDKKVELGYSTPRELQTLVVEGDEFRIEQVLNNLVSNAIKFTDQGCVTVEASIPVRGEKRITLRFSVQDTGVGINPDVIEYLGEPFIQADSSTTRKFGGTGLGLSICQSLLALMGSSLDITSTPDEGTTIGFNLDLPLTELTQAEPGQESDEHTMSPEEESPRDAMQRQVKARVQLHGPPRILVVEDSIAMQMLIKAIFQNLEIPITLAEHGGVAVQLLEDHDFDLVFMDLQMPEMGGVEATKKIRTKVGPEKLPIIILSATVQEDEIQECLAAGADTHLTKPIDMEALLTALLKYWHR